MLRVIKNYIKKAVNEELKNIAKIHKSVGHKSFDESGRFIKALEFETIWFNQWVLSDYSLKNSLSDDDYIDYHLWEDLNYEQLKKKYIKPNHVIYRGKNSNIVFHGGCLGCNSQQVHGLERCKGCSYFRGGNKSSLYIEGGECEKLSMDDLMNLINNLPNNDNE